jgi:hypothetical protein
MMTVTAAAGAQAGRARGSEPEGPGAPAATRPGWRAAC